MLSVLIRDFKLSQQFHCLSFLLVMLATLWSSLNAQALQKKDQEVDLSEARAALPFMADIFFIPEKIAKIEKISSSPHSSTVFFLIEEASQRRTLVRADAKTGAVSGAYQERRIVGLDKDGKLDTRWSGTGVWLAGKTADDGWTRHPVEESEVLTGFFKDYPEGSPNREKLSVEQFQELPVYDRLFHSVSRPRDFTVPFDPHLFRKEPLPTGVQDLGPVLPKKDPKVVVPKKLSPD